MTKAEMNVELARVLASKTNRPSRRDESVSRILESLPKGAKILFTEARDIYEWDRIKDDIGEYEENELNFLSSVMTKVYGTIWMTYDENINKKVLIDMSFSSEPGDALSIVIL
jgi:hypothetical protein